MFRSPSADEMVARGQRFHEAGKFQEAEAQYRHALKQNPNHPDALHLLGVLAYQHKQTEVAQELILGAIERNPANPVYYCNLSEVLASQKLYNAAHEALRQALTIDPQFPKALSNVGKVLFQLNRFEESEQSFIAAVAAYQKTAPHHPELPHLWNSLGVVYQRLHRPEKAADAIRMALTLKPGMDHSWHNLGTIYGDLASFAESENAYRTALKLNPASAQTHKNLGVCLQRRGHPQQAIAEFQKSIQLQNDYADAHWNLALALLLTGDFARGWKEYEWRWKYPQFGSAVREFPKPQWQGEDLCGKTLLLHTEQAYGDAIQFARYASHVAQRGANGVIVECQDGLVRLFESLAGVTLVVARFAPLPPYDVHIPFLSLPLMFNTTLEDIPHSVPYLSAREQRTAEFAGLLQVHPLVLPAESGVKRLRKVGLAWHGSVNHPYNRERSIPFSALAPLLEVENIAYVSLQTEPFGAGTENCPQNLIEMYRHIIDFADTAALLANLDLVITIDTSVAHLAGAMAKPVFLLLPFSPDWRWLLERADSPWYPTMRIFRQRAYGDWVPVIEEVQRALLEFLAARQG